MHTSRPSIRFVALAVVGLFVVALPGVLPNDADARRARGTTRTSVHRSTSVNRSAGVNRNTNVRRNVNVNRNVNVYGHGRYNHHNVGGAFVAGAVTGMVVGSIVAASALPRSCTTVVVNGISYQQCDNTWYQPQYSGTQVNYIVVNPPQ